ncbi:MAG: guanylate kinase [Candidatus Scalindua rubra]|uniref:Guanylate kinase n=1 Tax=Candidatus Scalindua rubra TaxID=1872076 RepID=A0A1E3XI96_9BACT|nr:MAG: guanylate kinase [Candidatus Scalindua rubra]
MNEKKSQNTNKKGRLIIISGPSGSGKTTICKQLVKNPKVNRSVSFTTREPRDSEKEGVDYCFVKKSEFEKLVEKGKFIEYADYCGSLYGTPIEPIKEAIHNGETFILAIDVRGALKIMEKIHEVTSIFIMTPDDNTLKQRLRKRLTDSEVEIRKRFKQAKEEMKYSKYYDYCVINDKLDDAVKEIEKILNL